MSNLNGLSFDTLNRMRESFLSDRANRTNMRAATSVGLSKAALDSTVDWSITQHFSIDLKQGSITNQKQSGRCWMFASLNTMRFEIIKKYKLKDFELSQSYPLFYDKLEKSNYFLESILNTLDEETDSRLIAHLLTDPVSDGGQWDMFVGLVEKYGVVPKDVMKETAVSSMTREMDRVLTRKLREYTCTLREAHAAGEVESSLRERKAQMIEEVYRILCISLGCPPVAFDLEMRDEDDNLIRRNGITPQEFFREFVGWDLSDYVSIISAPTKDKPFFRTYGIEYLGSVYEGRPVHYLNLPLDALKKAAIAQLSDGHPVWFGCDVGQSSARNGVMDPGIVRYDELFNVSFTMDRAQRLDYHESLITHAMVFLGVELDDSGAPVRWRVENSWGNEPGREGYYVMSDAWFDEYLYQVVVNRNYLPEEYRKMLSQEAIMLKPWDPMGSLAR